jgi:peptidyl-tRNA hydrolase
MKPGMYIFINKGLGMSPGKIAAQAGHAAVEATLLSHPALVEDGHFHGNDKIEALWRAWREGLHYVKYVMEARDAEHLLLIERYLNDRRFTATQLIIDEGRTEIAPNSATALGVALVTRMILIHQRPSRRSSCTKISSGRTGPSHRACL